MSWNRALLTGEDLEAYDEYLLSPEFLGGDVQERAARRHVATEVRTRGFFQGLNKDILLTAKDPVIQNKTLIKVPRAEWQFCFGPDYTLIDVYQAFKLCRDFKIRHKSSDTLGTMLPKLEKLFGSNVKILTDIQWEESGLRVHEKIEIRQTPTVTMMTPETVYSGSLVAVEITEEAAKMEDEIEPVEFSNRTDQEIRELAKAAGITSYHNKSIDKIKQELAAKPDAVSAV